MVLIDRLESHNLVVKLYGKNSPKNCVYMYGNQPKSPA